MYIKLGSINLQYYQDTNDWVILGEIVDSGMSYEKPILVRTTEELDIWFGKDFKDYSYMQELINMGVVLYLYKPISNKTTEGDNYIDLDNYTDDEEVWLRDTEIDWVEKVLQFPTQYKFQYNNGTEIKVVGLKPEGDNLIITEDIEGREFCTKEIARKELLNPINQISRIYHKLVKFHVYNSNNYWIYNTGRILDVALLPQNINLTSTSRNNRDSIIVSKESDPFEFTYVDYNYDLDSFGIYQDTSLVNSLEDIDPNFMREINPEKIATGYQTFLYRIEGDIILVEGDYFIFPNATHGMDTNQWRLIYSGNLELIPKEVRDMFEGKSIQISSGDQLLEVLREDLGYIQHEDNNKIYIYSKTILPVTNFYYSRNIKLIPEIKISEAVLYKYINTGMEFVSKTIGKSSEFEDDLISVTTQKTGSNRYKVIVSRYSYTETFEGLVETNSLGEERLDSLISRQSKLIRCNFYGEELRTGTYYLRGAQIEKTDPEMYKYSLKNMLSTDYIDPVYPDYFLIPDKYKYTSDIIRDDIYTLFLDYSKEVCCQFLVENNSTDELFKIVETSEFPSNPEEGTYYKVEDTYYDWQGNEVTDPYFIEVVGNGGDYVFNLTSDKENYLVYFYKSMTLNYDRRPAYYVYLRGLLLNNYSVSTKDVLYKTPTQDAFIVEKDVEGMLKRFKSNYLVCDNQTYFYKCYQDGDQYIMTGWTRFIAGKIFRELQKNSGNILGQQLLGRIRANIVSLLNSIVSGFSIVKSIGITNFEPENSGQSLRIDLVTVMNDLVKNNIDLSITVNYNNNYGTIS